LDEKGDTDILYQVWPITPSLAGGIERRAPVIKKRKFDVLNFLAACCAKTEYVLYSV